MSVWAVEQCMVTPRMASLPVPGKPWVQLVAGVYNQLVHRDRGVVMSDMPHDFALHRGFIEGAYGDVLVTGLGLGLVVKGLLNNQRVRSITVIEKEAEVIALTAASVSDPRVAVVQADALEYTPTQLFDCAWHDIWDTVEPHYIPLMRRIRAHYAPYCGWQALWGEPEAHAMSGRSPLVFALRTNVDALVQAIAQPDFQYPLREPMTVSEKTHLQNRDANTAEHPEAYRMLVSNGRSAADLALLTPVVEFIRANFPQAGELVRAGLNRQVQAADFRTPPTMYATPHTDHDFPHYVFICYLNTNNGVTRIFDQTTAGGPLTEAVQVKPERGLVIGFLGEKLHASSLATDAEQRNVAVMRFRK